MSLASERKSLTDNIPLPNIKGLADLIFGLALSIGALTLISEKPSSLTQIVQSLVFFGFTFYILASVWVRYSRIMSVLPVETGFVVFISIVLLFLVSLEPYLFNLMISSSSVPPPGQLCLGTTTSLFAADLGSIMLILAFFSHELAIEERKLIPKKLLESYRLQTYSSIATAAFFFVSMLPMFWTLSVLGVQSRYLVWTGFAISTNVRRLLERNDRKIKAIAK